MAEDQTLSAIVYKRGQLSILDQLKLPDQSIYLSIDTVNDAWNAIHQMSIRGSFFDLLRNQKKISFSRISRSTGYCRLWCFKRCRRIRTNSSEIRIDY